MNTFPAFHLEPRAAKQTCSYDKHHNLVCKKESFFHRVGRYILIGVLLFLLLTFLCCCLCCLKMRKKKAKNITDPNAPAQHQKSGLLSFLPFKKKQPPQGYDMGNPQAHPYGGA